MREKTNVYFLAEATRGHQCGDCILLENIDSSGNIIHALIDTGVRVYYGLVLKFLQKHNVKKLEFVLITHSHADHNGDTISVLHNLKVDKLIMKEFDQYWSPGGIQYRYEAILTEVVNRNIKVLGISFESLFSDEYSPSRSDDFKQKIKIAKMENFEYFNEENVKLKFGSSFIKLMNWEIFDSEGNLFVTGKNKENTHRDIYSGENQNSLGLLLVQGNQKAFFAGDMNNYDKNVGGKRIGDEDRLKNEIGKIDLLKLGHHGGVYSNTIDYLNTISPNFAIITNDIKPIYYQTYDFLENNKINYLYSTQDEYEVSATIYNDEVILGFGTEGLKKVNYDIFYIPEYKIYSNYLKSSCPVKYKSVEISVKNWEQLKNIIEESQIKGLFNKNENTYIMESLKINLETENDYNIYDANSSIVINNYKNIQIIVKGKEIIIKRGKTLVDKPLFKIEFGTFILGENNMNGKIIIDGNKENIPSSSHLIDLFNSDFSMYDNIILCNNLNKTQKRIENYSEYGSALFADFKSTINLYGGEISNNIHEIYIDKNMSESILPEAMESHYYYETKGAGIYMNNYSILNIYNGKIINNSGINNSDIYSNKNSTNNNSKVYSLFQRCLGSAIHAEKKSKIYLKKGEISNNIAVNNAKISLIEPTDNKKTNLSEISNIIYGSAIHGNDIVFEMENDFIIQNNSSSINNNFNIGKNCNINGKITSTFRGGQIYLYSSIVNIKGGTIQNSKHISNITYEIEPNPDGNNKTVYNNDIGGGLDFYLCKNIHINNLKINNCNANRGGGIVFDSSEGKIFESEFVNNFAETYGGGIYISNNSNVDLYNVKVLNNFTKKGSGGGIFVEGELTIDGENSSISDNNAGTYGGGLIITNKTIIKNCIISNNKAMRNSGGGIKLDGNLELINGKIYQNWCNEDGGGIHSQNSKSFIYNHNEVDQMVYKNTAIKRGNNIYP